jgi:hypothetical protein
MHKYVESVGHNSVNIYKIPWDTYYNEIWNYEYSSKQENAGEHKKKKLRRK